MFLVVDCRVFCLVQLLPVVVLVAVLETCKTSQMQVVLLTLVVVAVGWIQLLLTLKPQRVVLEAVVAGQLDSAASG